MKLSLSSDDKQIYKYQQNEKSPQIFEYKKDQDIWCIGVDIVTGTITQESVIIFVLVLRVMVFDQ
jgi:hypothetical protein